jgi:hypothetical protein
MNSFLPRAGLVTLLFTSPLAAQNPLRVPESIGRISTPASHQLDTITHISAYDLLESEHLHSEHSPFHLSVSRVAPLSYNDRHVPLREILGYSLLHTKRFDLSLDVEHEREPWSDHGHSRDHYAAGVVLHVTFGSQKKQ